MIAPVLPDGTIALQISGTVLSWGNVMLVVRNTGKWSTPKGNSQKSPKPLTAGIQHRTDNARTLVERIPILQYDNALGYSKSTRSYKKTTHPAPPRQTICARNSITTSEKRVTKLLERMVETRKGRGQRQRERVGLSNETSVYLPRRVVHYPAKQ